MTRFILALLIAAPLFSACSKKDQTTQNMDSAKVSAAPVKEGHGKGILKSIDTSGKTLLLDLGDVPGIMEPMTMSYVADPPQLLSAAKPGDSVAVTIQDRGQGDYVVTAIKPIGK
jgi:Cu(I)/Ag(I) efflux system membrane fusion protein/cobalt-zinc-cadmium efflux system membrane fusion protein